MNTAVPVHPSHTEQAPIGSVALVHRVPRTSLIDRVVMRVAVAMLIWSTRPDAQHTPHVSELADSPYAPLYARHAADDALARGALLHGVYVQPAGR